MAVYDVSDQKSFHDVPLRLQEIKEVSRLHNVVLIRG